MNRISFLGFGEELADRAFRRFRRVRRADDGPQAIHGVIAFERDRNAGAGGHERDQRIEEGALPMDFVKRPCLHSGQTHHLGCANDKTVGFEMGEDGKLAKGEDFGFCERISQSGVEIWADCDLVQKHWVTVPL